MDDDFSGLSGIDRVALNAINEGNDRASREMLLAISAIDHRIAALGGKDITWGDQYLRRCQADMIAALSQFAALEVVTKRDALALHTRLREYRRVAEFADSMLRDAAEAVRILNGEEPLDDGVGEPLDGEGTDGYGQVDD